MAEENEAALSKLATHSSAQRGSAAPSCGKPPAFRPVPDPSSSSAPAGRLSLPAGAEEVLQGARSPERQSLSAHQAAEPQGVADRIESNSDKSDIKSPLQGEVKSPPHRPWTLPPQGLALFHGDQDTARLSHYFLPRLLLEGKRVLMLDGANCADPRLLERLARQRRVPFEQFCRQIQIARAFTCFQLTELIARLPRLLADFPAEVLIVTAFPELYYDEDVRDWNAQVAFEQALANLRQWARSGDFTSPCRGGSADLKVSAAREPRLALTVAVFSSATTFMPSPARRRFFEKVCAAVSEVWQFNSNAEGKLWLVCSKRIVPRNLLAS